MTMNVKKPMMTATNSYEKKLNAVDLNDCATKTNGDFGIDLKNCVNSALFVVLAVFCRFDDHFSLLLNFFSFFCRVACGCLFVDSWNDMRNCATSSILTVNLNKRTTNRTEIDLSMIGTLSAVSI